MTNLVGTLKNSSGSTINGRLDVVLVRGLIDDTTTPDSWLLDIPASYVITNGVINIDLLESQTYQIPYKFTFYEKVGETDDVPVLPIYSDSPRFEFYSIVPNVGSVQFTSLTPTGISNANLDTGALTIARYLANDANLITLIRPDFVDQAVYDGETVTTKKFFNKPFSEGIKIKNLKILSPAGYTDWAFRVGYIDNDGVDQLVTLDQTVNDEVVSGRRYINLLYDASLPDVIKGFYIEAVAGVTSGALTAYCAITYQRTV